MIESLASLEVSLNPSVTNLVRFLDVLVQQPRLANLSTCPGLRTAEALLQSIIWALTTHRHQKKKTRTLTLAQQTVTNVPVTAQITTLIGATKEAPQWPKHIA